MRHLPLTLLSLVLLGAGCAHTGINTPDGWNVVKTKHFTMYTPTVMSHDETLNSLEYHYAALSSSFFKADVGNVEILFLERADFQDFFGHKRPFVAMPRVPGKGSIGAKGLIIMPPLSTSQTDNEDDNSRLPFAGERGVGLGPATTTGSLDADNAAAEALTHLFIQRSMAPGTPLWFHEGFAAYARTLAYQEGEGKRQACFGLPERGEKTLIPLEKMLAINWDDYDGGEARSWFKYTARMLIDFTMHADGGKRVSAMGTMLDQFGGDKSQTDIVKAAFRDLGLEKLNARISEHSQEVLKEANSPGALRGLCPLGFGIPPEKAPDIGTDRKLAAVPVEDMRALLEALKKLPARDDGYQPWYPEEIISRVEGGAPAK